MSATIAGRYDPVLQMFIEEPRPLDINRLLFYRWLVEHGRTGHAERDIERYQTETES